MRTQRIIRKKAKTGRRGRAAVRCLLAVCLLVFAGVIVPGAATKEPEKTVTRKDMEDAVVATAFAYHFKKEKIQYDSQEIGTTLSKYYGGTYRLTEDVPPEYGTSDTNIYSVCSDYIYKVYYYALGYRLFGAPNCLDATTAAFWLFGEKQPDELRGDDPSVDTVLLRWIKDGCELTETYRQWGVTDRHCVSLEEMRAFVADWEHNLRPGDMIVTTGDSGHAMLYVGNGFILDCRGYKYNMEKGTDRTEDSGVPTLFTVEGMYLDGTESKTFWMSEKNKSLADYYVILRPLDILTEDDGDGDPANDPARPGHETIPGSARSRLAWPGLEIDRTVDISPYGTAQQGGELTYTVKISNRSTMSTWLRYCRKEVPAYSGSPWKGLPVTEIVPAGTELVPGSVSGGGTEENGTIRWSVDLEPGKSVSLSYRVRVTGAIGSRIVSGGGTVGDIPSNTLTNRIGGAPLPEEMQKAMLTASGKEDPAAWVELPELGARASDLAFASWAYRRFMGIETEFPSASQLLDGLFFREEMTNQSRSIRYEGEKTIVPIRLKPEDAVAEEYLPYRRMIVDGFLGGKKMVFPEQGGNLNELRFSYLKAGDILVCLKVSGGIYHRTIMVYLGGAAFTSADSTGFFRLLKGMDARAALEKLFTEDCFFVLRPSQYYEDISLLKAEPAAEPSSVPEDEGTESAPESGEEPEPSDGSLPAWVWIAAGAVLAAGAGAFLVFRRKKTGE